MGSINGFGATASALKAYGKTWGSIDFMIDDKIYTSKLRNEYFETKLGTLIVDHTKVSLNIKAIKRLKNEIGSILDLRYIKRTDRKEKSEIDILGTIKYLNSVELNRLHDTLEETYNVIHKKYSLGLYL